MEINKNERNLRKVAVVGAGSWGTALGNLFADQCEEVILWGRDAETVRSLNERHENTKYLKGVTLSPNLKATESLESALDGADLMVGSIPTQQIRNVLKPVANLLGSTIILNSSKGIELGTHLRVSEIYQQFVPQAQYAILSGPSFALEVAQRLPTAVTVACRDREISALIQRQLSNSYFRVYTSTDVNGVELAGALKNVVAIATGVVTGLGLGYNAQAAVINRGIAEIMRMGKRFGADPLTFLGLAGTGDLILTCTGPLSRNRTLGVKLGQGKALADIQRELGGIAEGVYTAQSARELALRNGIDMPITEQVYLMLYEKKSAKQALADLMVRDLKEEGT